MQDIYILPCSAFLAGTASLSKTQARIAEQGGGYSPPSPLSHLPPCPASLLGVAAASAADGHTVLTSYKIVFIIYSFVHHACSYVLTYALHNASWFYVEYCNVL
jgi:hypothetical protein